MLKFVLVLIRHRCAVVEPATEIDSTSWPSSTVNGESTQLLSSFSTTQTGKVSIKLLEYW